MIRMKTIFVAFVTCFILDTESTPPRCNTTYGYVELPENSRPGTEVYNVSCSDPDPGMEGILSYTITDGNSMGKFAINTSGNIGKVYVYQSISYESRTTRFQLVIKVSDYELNRQITYFHLDIQITGVNDYAPLFLFSPYTVYINEDVRPGSVIATPIPYDFDRGQDGETISAIVDGVGMDKFYMDPTTAKVYLRQLLDYELETSYTIKLQVSDKGFPIQRTSTTILNINVKDINDNSPKCDDTYLTETIQETKRQDTVIKYLKCTDADSGNNGKLSYDILQGDYTKFNIQAGYVLLRREIDADTEPHVWPLRIHVSDKGDPRNSIIVDLIVYVEGVDDNAPVWVSSLQGGNHSTQVYEHSAIGTHVISISVHDPDTLGNPDSEITYKIDDVTSVFTMKPDTGDIYVSADIDYEKDKTFLLRLSAFSAGNTENRIHGYVYIKVIDDNDNKPIFLKDRKSDQHLSQLTANIIVDALASGYSEINEEGRFAARVSLTTVGDVFQFSVAENATTGTDIVDVQATDKDSGLNGEIIYSVIAGDTANLFKINPLNGVIRLAGRLDYESSATYTLLITATDRGRPSQWSTATAVINILPVNEFEPMFRETYVFVASEDAEIGTSLFQLSGSDADNGPDGDILYHLNSFNDTFTIESRTGVVRLVKELDRERIDNYRVYVSAVDQSQTQPKTGSITISISVQDANDQSPECEMFYSVRITSSVISGEEVAKINCTDKDIGVNARLSYVIFHGNGNNDFSVSNDGWLVAMRRPTLSMYKLYVLVRDSGSPPLNATAIIFIKAGGKPVIQNLPMKISMYEDTPFGSVVYKVTATSVSSALRFYVDLNDTDPIIRVNEVTGELFLWSELDRERVSFYKIPIVTVDTISKEKQSNFLELEVLDVNDNPPKFSNSIYNISIVESVQVMSTLITLEVSDADINENAQIQFKLKTEGIEKSHFAIGEDGALILKYPLDREVSNREILVITAIDNGKDVRLTGSATILLSIIDADEYPPEFITMDGDVETFLKENTPLGAVVFHLEARDLDVESNIKYSLLCRDGNDTFIVDSDNGDIYLSKLLDRETRDKYVLTVAAKNKYGIQTSIDAHVTIVDINDNEPQFSNNIFSFQVNEHAYIGSIAGTVNCTDADEGENAYLSFSIERGNIGNAFIMNGQTLHINNHLSFDTITEYLLRIEARDSGNPQKSSTASIIVRVLPETRTPDFGLDLKVLHIPENTLLGSVLYDVDATFAGAKEGISGDLVYSIVSGNPDNMFSISQFDGIVSLSFILDRDGNYDSVSLAVSAVNKYIPSLQAIMTLKILVDDVNDFAPKFEQHMYTYYVREDADIGSSVGKVHATDADLGSNSLIGYEIRPNNFLSFRIVSGSGDIILDTKPDFLKESKYQFIVLAFDHGSPQLTGTAYVIIEIIDINNKKPTFQRAEYTLHVNENTNVGATIQLFVAVDEDTGPGGDVMYKTSPASVDAFKIDPMSGALVLAKELDREIKNEFSFVIFAEDQDNPQLTGTAVVAVFVEDVNDNSPVFEKTFYFASVNRFAGVNTIVTSVTAADIDAGVNAKLEYQIEPSVYSSLFQIDRISGTIKTFSDLSARENMLKLTILSIDLGRPRQSGSTVVSIDVFPSLTTVPGDFNFSVSEYSLPNFFVGIVAPNVEEKLTFFILSGNYKESFRLDHKEGKIYLKSALDHEEYAAYDLIVSIRNTNIPSQEQNINVHINVLDENDNTPTFTSNSFVANVLEYTPVGYEVLKLTATDADSGRNGDLLYAIVPDNKQANDLFYINSNGGIYVNGTINHDIIQNLNFNVIAMDRGVFSRSGTAVVSINVVDIPGEVIGDNSSSVISLEIPVTAEYGYVVAILTSDMFGINKVPSDTTVRYNSVLEDNVFSIGKESGKVILEDETYLFEHTYYITGVVAEVEGASVSTGKLALLRMDTFQPNTHVIIFFHPVARELIELNKKHLLNALAELFPGGRPVIWKIDGATVSGRRKLLSSESQTYLYVIKNAETDSITEFMNPKTFYSQDELMEMFLDKDGSVSEALKSEPFDSFPVTDILRYLGSERSRVTFLRSKIGQAVVGIIVAVAILLITFVVTYFWYTRKYRQRKEKPNNNIRNNDVRLNIDPEEVEDGRRITNNLSMTSSSGEALPVMNALAVLKTLNEKERRKVFEKFLIQNNDNETHESMPPTPRDRAKTKRVSFWDRKNTSPSSLDLKSQDQISYEKQSDERWSSQRKPFRKDTQIPIIIAEKEFNEFGRDKSNRHYVYNTHTGDKMYVTHEELTKATEKKDSDEMDCNQDYSNIPVRKVSRGCSPIRRKTSKTRLSTTTIWEMSVDADTDLHDTDLNDDGWSNSSRSSGTIGFEPIMMSSEISEDDAFESSSDESSSTTQGESTLILVLPKSKQRRFGIDHTRDSETKLLSVGHLMSDTRDRLTSDDAEGDDTDEDSELTTEEVHDKPQIFSKSPKDECKELSMKKNDIVRKLSNQKTWEKILQKAGFGFQRRKTILKKQSIQRTVARLSSSSSIENIDLQNEKETSRELSGIMEENNSSGPTSAWTPARECGRFIRPLHKPLNLDHVTCKVPKGRSNPKDCLSRDPVYTDWARVVGRKPVKKIRDKSKRGRASIVDLRHEQPIVDLRHEQPIVDLRHEQQAQEDDPKAYQMLADVMSFTSSISSKPPPHLAKARVTYDI